MRPTAHNSVVFGNRRLNSLFKMLIMITSLSLSVESINVQVIADYMKGVVNETFDRNRRKMGHMMIEYFITNGMYSAQSHWAKFDKYLTDFSEEDKGYLHKALIPENITRDDCNNFIDTIAKEVGKNPNVVKFLETITGQEMGKFTSGKGKQKVEHHMTLGEYLRTEGRQYLPRVVASAMCLNNLVTAMRENHKVVEACYKFWDNKFPKLAILNSMKAVGLVKFLSVRHPIQKFVGVFEAGNSPADLIRRTLWLNIREAAFLDGRAKRKNNAKAGRILARYSKTIPSKKIPSARAEIAHDNEAVLMGMPQPCWWANLYQSWNMGFVMHMKDFPHWLTKLLIPVVCDYNGKDNDGAREYIYRRALALYSAMIHHAGRDKRGDDKFRWVSEELMEKFGEVNCGDALNYRHAVDPTKAANGMFRGVPEAAYNSDIDIRYRAQSEAYLSMRNAGNVSASSKKSDVSCGPLPVIE